jgi:hypothetical protein
VKTRLKKITSFLFLLLGFIPLLFVLVITIKKQNIRQRMKANLEQQHLQTIILPEKEVAWVNDHEIWVHNSLFDIHTKNYENGVYTFTGLYDKEETKLVEKERETTGKNKEQNKLLAQLFKCLPVFCTQQSEILNLLPRHDSYNQLISPDSNNQYREILTPPPQVCC